KKAPAEAAATNESNLSQEERRRLARNVQNAERAVEKIEADVAVFEAKMADPGFYESPDAQRVIDQYNLKKKELDEAMAKWEEAQMAMDT
ncbi:MAG TPA: ABC transporter ATP-binding protein, partial [Saprospiraceae bacterium]|nr:ABC transporter ATP-binding protein [Saprospiraceae bacterium]